jgi:RimJ/RimL family protein N-acetyltransferase
MEAIAKFKEIYSREGIKGVACKSLKRVSRSIIDTNSAFWLERDLNRPIANMRPAIPVNVDLFAREETIEWFKNRPESWIYNEKELEVAREEGHIFPNLKHQGRIVGYAKIGIGRVYIADYKKVIKLPEKTAICYDYYIIPEYGGRFLSAFILNATLRIAKEEGYIKTLGHIPPWNITALRIAQKLKFEKKSYVRHFRILGFLKFYLRRKVGNNEETY